MSNTIPFNILRKTESPDSLLNHGAYNMHKKHLRKTKELLFYEQIQKDDVYYFKHVPNLEKLHMAKGVDYKETLENIFDYPFVKLNEILIYDWQYSNIDVFQKVKHLQDLEVGLTSKSSSIVFSHPMLQYLTLNISEEVSVLDLSQSTNCEDLNFTGALPQKALLLPRLTTSVTVGGFGLIRNYQHGLGEMKTSPFNPTIFIDCEFINSLTLRVPIDKKIHSPLPQIKNLELYDSTIAISLIPKIFPNVNTLLVFGLNITQLEMLFRTLIHLQSIDIQSTDANEIEIINLKNNYPLIKIEATKEGDGIYTQRYFDDGQWHERTTR
jgi:hypothetical protein